jgi:CRISPR-associated endonuclease/helicase Cas3
MKPLFAAHTPPDDFHIWHELVDHLSEVGDRTQRFASKFDAGMLGYYSGLWHDLGKFNPAFQTYLQQCHSNRQAGQQKKTRGPAHAIHGAILAHELKCTPLSFLIAGHHAGLPNQSDLSSKLKDPSQRSIYADVMKQASAHLSELKPIEDLRDYFKKFGQDKIAADLFLRLIFSCLIDADRLDTEKFANPEQYELRLQRSKAVTLPQLWQTFERQQQQFTQGKSSDSPVNRVRSEVYQKCLEAAVKSPGVFRLCVPTGGGKTRSGLAFALKHAMAKSETLQSKDLESDVRIIFAVPYTSIIEQTVKVYRQEIFKELGEFSVLEHHSAVQMNLPVDSEQLESDEVTEESKVQSKLATQNWDAKLIVTTTVQLFESLFSNRTSQCRKLHNIVNSVIVLDEVQTLPIGLLTPILSVLKELVDRYNVTVVLCTATQPALAGDTPYFKGGFSPEMMQEIIPEEMAKKHFQDLKRVRYEIPRQGETWSWADLTQDMQSSSSSLVVLNTRRDALAVLDALNVASDLQPNELPVEKVCQVLTDASVLHLSTLLCGVHRQVVIEEVKRRLREGLPCTLVSTQVVEAGVDLDFPTVYRAMGPLDRIVQAAGRCNREGRLNQLGRVVIFEPSEGSKPPGDEYGKAIGKTRSLIQAEDFQEQKLHEPGIFQEYFRNIYPLIANTNSELDVKGVQGLRKSWNFRDVGETFKLIEDDSVPVVVVYDREVEARIRLIESRGVWSSDRAKLQPYVVNLPRYVFNQTKAKKEIADNLWQWTGSYDPIRGIAWEQKDDVPVYGFLCV